MRAEDLQATRTRLIEQLGAGDEARRDALELLCSAERPRRRALLDAELATAIVAALDQPHRTQQRRVADAVVTLLADAPPLAEALQLALGAPSARLRWGAAYVLGRAGAPPAAAWAAARETLALDDGDQRWAAAELAVALVRAHPALRDELLAGLTAPSATLRKMTLYCLRDLGDPELARLACERLADTSPGVRLAALGALARTPPAEDSALKIATLLETDPDAGVRRAAAATLGRLGSVYPAVRTALDAAAGSPDPSLARAARTARAALERVATT